MVLLLGVTAGDARPQPLTGDPRQTSAYRQVDQGHADQTPLSASSRVVPMDLRQPLGFDQLFQLTGPGGRLETRGMAGRTDGTSGLYFRFSGGLVASFPRSVYAETPAGLQALIPPGTVFSIGQAGAWGPGARKMDLPPRANASSGGLAHAAASGATRSARAASTSSTSPLPRRDTDASRTPFRDAGESGSLWTSEAYRRRLIERLLLLANPG